MMVGLSPGGLPLGAGRLRGGEVLYNQGVRGGGPGRPTLKKGPFLKCTALEGVLFSGLSLLVRALFIHVHTNVKCVSGGLVCIPSSSSLWGSAPGPWPGPTPG